jgi:hypothetical protein
MPPLAVVQTLGAGGNGSFLLVSGQGLRGSTPKLTGKLRCGG